MSSAPSEIRVDNARRSPSTIGSIIASMRLQQWVKNLLLFAALVFGGQLFDPASVAAMVLGFFCFSFVASGVYVFNDILDLERDKLHPEKSKRPLASGALSVGTAWKVSAVLVVGGIVGGFLLHPTFGFLTLGYLALNVAYTLKLKELVILDVMTIAAGFVLRVIAGAVLIDVPISHWLILCTILLSLFLGFSKRRHELTLIESGGTSHRTVLAHYSPYFLDQMIGIVTSSTVVAYMLYTVSDETVSKFGTSKLVVTLPFVLYGIFRYLYLVHKREEGGNPTRVLFTDRPLLVTIVLWIATAATIIYARL
jgi:4-hydroxybenzoate polyprenyltransferase